MEDMFRFADPLGPAKIVHIHLSHVGLKAVVVIDNIACGPAIGGVRMAPDVSVKECVRLARAMTLKNAAAGLPHGGGKSVIFGDPRMPAADKERIIRAFACAMRDLVDYIPGPDMGTTNPVWPGCGMRLIARSGCRRYWAAFHSTRSVQPASAWSPRSKLPCPIAGCR